MHLPGQIREQTRGRAAGAETRLCVSLAQQPGSPETGELRGLLLDAYAGTCALSGCAVPEVLEVALIDPSGPAEPANALLLRADIGRLFAAGLLAVDAFTLEACVAPALANSEYAGLGGRRLRQPDRAGQRPARQALDAHHRLFALQHDRAFPARQEGQNQRAPEAAPLWAIGPRRPSPQRPAGGLPALQRSLLTKSMVNALAYTRDGSTLASGSWDGVARLWRTSDGALLNTLHADLGEINAVAFSPDGRLFAAAGRNRAVQLWRVRDGAPLLALNDGDGHSGAVFSVAFSPDGTTLATGSWDRSLRIWRVADGRLHAVLDSHRGAVNSVAYSPNGRLVATGSHDRQVRIWRADDGTLLHTLHGHSDAVFSVAFSPNGRTLASAGCDQTIRLWRVADGSSINSLEPRQGAVFSVAFSPDGGTLATGDYGKAVRFWCVADGAHLHSAHGHGEGVTAVAFSPDGQTLASGSFDATVRLWTLAAVVDERL